MNDLFSTSASSSRVKVQATDTVNNSGGRAYSLGDQELLAKLAVVGTFGNTFVASGQDQLDAVLALSAKVSDTFLAQLAIYSKKNGRMRLMPAVLTAILSTRNPALFRKVFAQIADGNFIRHFVNVIRSGKVGRRSFGKGPKRMIQKWLSDASNLTLLQSSVGTKPSMGDVISMVHPTPKTLDRQTLFMHLLGKNVTGHVLPTELAALREWQTGNIPEAGVLKGMFELLTGAAKTDEQWKFIARQASWRQTVKNLNTFVRHGLDKDPSISRMIEERLMNVELIEKAKAMPYELLAAFINAESIPRSWQQALRLAMELSVVNVPFSDAKVAVLVDVSGSMNNSISGNRKGATSKIRCIDCAALLASIIQRQMPNATVILFDKVVRTEPQYQIVKHRTILDNAEAVGRINGGATKYQAALAYVNQLNTPFDLIVTVSDYESWLDDNDFYGVWDNSRAGSGAAYEWAKFARKYPKARLINIDITPNKTTQVKSDYRVMNVGGFSQDVVELVLDVANGGFDTLIDRITAVEL